MWGGVHEMAFFFFWPKDEFITLDPRYVPPWHSKSRHDPVTKTVVIIFIISGKNT